MPSVEKWKQIQTHPNYEVSNQDECRIRRKELIGARPPRTQTGYEKGKSGRPKLQRTHSNRARLVAKAFLPNPEGHACSTTTKIPNKIQQPRSQS